MNEYKNKRLGRTETLIFQILLNSDQFFSGSTEYCRE